MAQGNAEILLFQADGSVVLQVRDDKPGITNPGLISSFGGHIEDGEQPIDAALREINEETNLNIRPEQLFFYDKRCKTKAKYGEDWDVYYFGVKQVNASGLEVYEGSGYTVIRNLQELKTAKTSLLLSEVLTDYFEGFRNFLFLPDIDPASRQELYKSYLAAILAGHSPSKYTSPIALACTGLVASGKSTITAPLAETSDCVTLSSDKLREEHYIRGFNFSDLRPMLEELFEYLVAHHYNIFLDMNISTNIRLLDSLREHDYKIYITHANPPYDYIKNKILSGNIKRDLTFFAKSEFMYKSMLTWKDEHLQQSLPELQKRYDIWREVDTSRSDLADVIQQMQVDFQEELKTYE